MNEFEIEVGLLVGDKTFLNREENEAIEFLRNWNPAGPWVLSAIALNGPIESRSFTHLTNAENWIDSYNGERNLYFVPNKTRTAVISKPSKDDIEEMVGFHVDIDPRDGEDLKSERKRILKMIKKFSPAPTAVVDSGNGYQAFWKLNESIFMGGDKKKAENAESYNKTLSQKFGADACHTCDHLMRLPGTINIPTKKKEKLGRVRSEAKIVEELTDWSRIYSIDEFEKTAGNPDIPSVNVVLSKELPHIENSTDIPELRGSRWTKTHQIIHQGKLDHHLSRSEAIHAVCCEMDRAGCDDDTIASVLLNRSFGISEKFYEQSDPEKHAIREIEAARKEVALKRLDFSYDDKGKPYSNAFNIRIALHKLDVRVSHNTFSDRLLIQWPDKEKELLDDSAIVRLWITIEEQFYFRPAKQYFMDVVEDEARQNAFHPVCDYLDDLKWDGKSRLDHWLTTYGRAEDSEYTRAVGSLVLIAAVRRVRNPGCKFDEMLVLESPQGKLKSTALSVLAVEEDWFTDDLPLNGDTKRGIEALSGRWIVEASELNGMKKGEVEHLKAFLSRQIDSARMAYGRLTSEYPRQCVIIGTTNSVQYLKDGIGNRRFWPVKVDQFDIEALKRDRNLIWAEAAYRESQGENIRLDKSLYGAAAEQQEQRRVEDPWVETLATALGDREGKIRSENVWKILGMPTERRTQYDNGRMGSAMKELGFERKKMRFNGRPEWCYVRGEDKEEIKLETHVLGRGTGDDF